MPGQPEAVFLQLQFPLTLMTNYLGLVKVVQEPVAIFLLCQSGEFISEGVLRENVLVLAM